MSRPPAKKSGQKTKPFTVSKGYIMGDNDGKRCVAGDTINLTRDQALYHQKLGSITIEVPEFDDDEPTEHNTEKAKIGHKVNRAGESIPGEPPAEDDAPAKPKSRR